MYCTGIYAIEFGQIAADGDVATTFAALGQTLSDTLNLAVSEDQTEDVDVEEQDDPIFQIVKKKGTLDISWSMVDFDDQIMIALFGGAVVNGQWHAPNQIPAIEKSLRIRPKTGRAFIYPRVNVVAQTSYDSGKKIFKLDIKCRRLQPTKQGVPNLIWDAPVP